MQSRVCNIYQRERSKFPLIYSININCSVSLCCKKTASKKHMTHTAPKEGQEEVHDTFHQESTSFRATVIGMSVARSVFIICSVGSTAVRYSRRKISVDLEAGKK